MPAWRRISRLFPEPEFLSIVISRELDPSCSRKRDPPSLKAVLKRLKLSGVVPILPDRVAYAQKASLSPLDFLELVLQDEIDRREHRNLANRLGRKRERSTTAPASKSHRPSKTSTFPTPTGPRKMTSSRRSRNAPVTFDRDRVVDLFSLSFLSARAPAGRDTRCFPCVATGYSR